MYNNNKPRPHDAHTQAQSVFWILLPKMDRIQSYWWVIFLLAAAVAVDGVTAAASWKRPANQQTLYVYKMRNVSFMVYKCCGCGFDLSATLLLIVVAKMYKNKHTH